MNLFYANTEGTLARQQNSSAKQGLKRKKEKKHRVCKTPLPPPPPPTRDVGICPPVNLRPSALRAVNVALKSFDEEKTVLLPHFSRPLMCEGEKENIEGEKENIEKY